MQRIQCYDTVVVRRRDIRQASSVWQGYLAAEDGCSQSATTRLTFSTSLCRQRRVEALACRMELVESCPSAVTLVLSARGNYRNEGLTDGTLE
jgi:hypothetical protein